MTCCYHCRGKFGLVRYRRGGLAFCSKKCLRAFMAVRDHKIAWLRWLYS
jgi:hypothetical protein